MVDIRYAHNEPLIWHDFNENIWSWCYLVSR